MTNPKKNSDGGENLALGVLQMVVASFFFAIMGALAKAHVARIHPMELVFFRSIVAVVVMAALMVRRQVAFAGSDKVSLITRGVSGGLALALNFYVIGRIDLAAASVLNQTAPFFVALLSFALLKEQVTPRLLACIAAAFVGVLLIVKPGASVSSLPGFLGVLSGFFAAAAYVAIKKMLGREHPYTIIFYFAWISTALSLLFLPKFVAPTPREAAELVLMGLSATLAQWLMTLSYRHGPASVISPFAFANVIFSALFGALFWNEIPDAWAIGGSLIIIVSGIRLMRLGRKPKMPLEFHGLR